MQVASTDSSASSGNESNNEGGAPNVDPKVNEVLEQVKKDMFKFKTEAKELREKLKAQETADLESKQQYKTLYEQEKKRADEAEAKAKKTGDAFVNHHKFSTVKSQAEKLGLRPEAAQDLELLPMDDVLVETTNTGKWSIIGADSFVERLKTRKPHWFTDPGAPNINVTTPSVVNGGRISVEDVSAAQAKWLKSKSPADRKDYEDKTRRFQTQSRKK